MNTQEKYGIRNRQAILLFIQMLIIKLGIIIQSLVLIFEIINHMSAWMIVGTSFIILAHIGVFIYSYFGYKKGKVFYYVTVGSFLLSILIYNGIPYVSVVQHILLTLIFGLICVFALKQEDYKFANVIIFIAAALALGFGIYSSIIAKPDSIGDIEAKIVVEIAMYLSLFAPLIMVGVFGVAYNARHEKEKYLEEKAS